MKKALIALCLGLCSLSVHAETAPIKVKSGPSNAGPSYSKVYITALVNSIVVKNITVNRGNCKDAEARPWKPVRINFGNTYDRIFTGRSVLSGCNILEIVVDTDQGAWELKIRE
ncbi:hypothetical protein LW347_13420 [Pectobacterium polonicum]|uniref:DUF2541 family protein n=1 Tax=Pectobacterium polonicum TaxID=2485124 RepID=A0AAE9NKW0_9GAMM|nr:hypothetical protein [Pectobacterium polonicum]UVO06915.1 hypothetical protein LW347_13420 [Pectobacterium polonicum]